jgi:hypothetical protein
MADAIGRFNLADALAHGIKGKMGPHGR